MTPSQAQRAASATWSATGPGTGRWWLLAAALVAIAWVTGVFHYHDGVFELHTEKLDAAMPHLDRLRDFLGAITTILVSAGGAIAAVRGIISRGD